MLTDEEYGSWKRDPRTEKVFKYLGDRLEELKESWAQGDLSPHTQAAAHTIGEIINLSAAEIRQQYEEENDRTEHPAD